MDIATEKPNKDEIIAEIQKRWKKENIQATFGTPSDELIGFFINSKKTTEKIWPALQQYAMWSNRIDYATIPWEEIEDVLRLNFLVPLGDPFPFTTKEKSQVLFVNIDKFDPPTIGTRRLVATMWVQDFFLLFFVFSSSTRFSPFLLVFFI